MNNQDIADEIEALSAILCAASEFEVKSSDENEVILVIQPQQINSNVISLTVVLDPKSYPSSSPQLSVQVFCFSSTQYFQLSHFCFIFRVLG